LKARITALFLRLPFLRKPHLALDVLPFVPIFLGVGYMRAQVAPAQKNPPQAMRIAGVKVFLERRCSVDQRLFRLYFCAPVGPESRRMRAIAAMQSNGNQRPIAAICCVYAWRGR